MVASGPILVPLDGSKLAENAMPVAVQLASALERPLRVVHVAESVSGAEYERARELFASYAASLAHRAGGAVAPADTLVLRGRPAHSILEAARDASVVVLSTHGRSGFRATFIGSVADKVMRGSPVPVLAIPGIERHGPLGAGPVLIALDGAEHGGPALEVGRAFAAALGRKRVLIRAYTSLVPMTAEFAYLPPEIEPALAGAARAYLEGVAQPGEEIVVVHGEPAPAIVAAAGEIDASLVVLASSGKSLPARVALGSTTDRVLHSIARPLLVTHGEGE